MINWLVRHMDAIEDNIKRKKETETYKDLCHIIAVIFESIFFVIKCIFYFFMGIVVLELCWCILN